MRRHFAFAIMSTNPRAEWRSLCGNMANFPQQTALSSKRDQDNHRFASGLPIDSTMKLYISVL